MSKLSKFSRLKGTASVFQPRQNNSVSVASRSAIRPIMQPKFHADQADVYKSEGVLSKSNAVLSSWEKPYGHRHCVISNSVDIVSQLYHNKQQEFLTDVHIVFHCQSYPCHSSFLSSFSPILKEKLLSSDPEVNLPQLESLVPDADLFFQILDYCYGQPFQLTLGSIGFVLTLCSALQLSSLIDPIHRVMSEGFSKSRHLQLKSEEVLQTIKSSVQRDVMISYMDQSLTICSLVLICCSEYFKNIFCSNYADSKERNFSYSAEFYGVPGSSFQTFFKYFLGESFNLDVNNVVDFYQLAVYFKVKQLKEICDSFVSSLTSTTDILTLLKTISERNLMNVLYQNLNLFVKLDYDRDLTSPFTLPLPWIFLLIDSVTSSWVLQCLTFSINREVFEEDYNDLIQIFEKVSVNDQNINEIYTSLLPLFDQDYLSEFLLTWSMKVFQGVQNVDVIPHQWFLWCLSQSCLNHKRTKILHDYDDFLVQNFSLIIDNSDLLKNCYSSYLTPEILKDLKNCLPSSYDLFLIKCLVKSWKETELWTVQNFKCAISLFAFHSSEDTFEILNILSELITDTQLARFLTVDLLKHSLAALKDSNEQFVLLNSELKSLKQSPLIEKQSPLIEKHAALIGTFNSSFCGSELCLSSNNSVVKKTGSDSIYNSFVEVNISDNCSVKFTRLDDPDNVESDYIGWKDRGSLQNSPPGLCICPLGAYNGSFSPSNPGFPTITRGESITVSYSNGKARFKPSTCTAYYSIDIPSNLVFGLTVWGQNHEWKVERV
ncbi:hypothetical protein GEMRC1_000945 [Eukaryota sp. GEM-RC1]